MLAIGIELYCIVVTVLACIPHTRLKCTGKPQVHRQVNVVITALLADIQRKIARTVVNHHIIDTGSVITQVLDSGHDIVLFVVRRNDGKYAAVSHERSCPLSREGAQAPVFNPI